MFNIGPEKLILLFIIALVVLGPTKLPDAARTAGKVIGELRRMSGSFREEVREVLADPHDMLTSAAADLREEINGFRSEITGLKSDASRAIAGSSDTSQADGSPAPASAPSTAPANVPSLPQLPPSPDDPSLN